MDNDKKSDSMDQKGYIRKKLEDQHPDWSDEQLDDIADKVSSKISLNRALDKMQTMGGGDTTTSPIINPNFQPMTTRGPASLPQTPAAPPITAPQQNALQQMAQQGAPSQQNLSPEDLQKFQQGFRGVR